MRSCILLISAATSRIYHAIGQRLSTFQAECDEGLADVVSGDDLRGVINDLRYLYDSLHSHALDRRNDLVEEELSTLVDVEETLNEAVRKELLVDSPKT
jgi:hypothetical protein